MSDAPNGTNIMSVDFHIIGDAFVDMFCFLGGDWPEQGGDAQLSHPIELFAGGSSVNTTTHLNSLLRYFDAKNTQLSLHTVLNPNDPHGQTLLNHASKHSFTLLNCKPEEEETATGHCVAIVSGQDRSFCTYRGCVDTFSADNISLDSIISSDAHSHLHIAGYYNLSGFQNGQIKNRIEHIREGRQQNSRTTTVSLVPQHDASKQWDSGIDELIPCLDFLIMNDMEAMYIVRKSRTRKGISVDAQLPSFCTDEHIADFACFFGDTSPSTCIVITRGAAGAVVLRGGKIVANQAAFKVDPIDPTGAGDSFAAGFLYGLSLSGSWKKEQFSNREALEKALLWGCALGTASVRTRGASLPSAKEKIEHFYHETVELNAK